MSQPSAQGAEDSTQTPTNACAELTGFEEKLCAHVACKKVIREDLLELNKFYQERIETIRTRLWVTLTWLAAVQGGALVLTIKQGGLRTDQGPQILLEQPVMIVLLSILSLFFALYMVWVAKDGIKHIQRNFRLSNITVGLPPESTQKSFDWFSGESSIKLMIVLARVALIIEVGILCIGLVGTYEWLFGKDISWVQNDTSWIRVVKPSAKPAD